jgi:hypothetical protein
VDWQAASGALRSAFGATALSVEERRSGQFTVVLNDR